ncbi:uncharacterized protein LOC131207132 [Anopheles bellator]|uniref:uncharacterized protein LOC131207132 n=1 Tax=Anopheles bellator TaxID=139047 RepID=UPI002649F41E|nr:uncharacterized protein LOC131207132 [Anopheles bellator]
MEFLTRNTIELVLRHEDEICCTGTLSLWNYEVGHFHPTTTTDGGRAVQLEFDLVDPQTRCPVGVGSVLLQFSVDEPTVDQTSIMYVINDPVDQGKSDRTKRSSAVAEGLLCETCNGLRSTEELDLQYELIDGILHSKAMGSTEQEIRRIKAKVRGLVMDESIGPRDTFTPESTMIGFVSSYCDRCNACLNWLPDFCRCPKCGHKKSQAAEGGHHVHPSKYWATAAAAAMSSAERSTTTSAASVTVVASSQSCPICHLRQGRCVDCSNEIEQRQQQGASSESELLEQQRSVARPVTRRPRLKDRQRTRTGKRQSVEVREPTVQRERLARLRKAYAGESPLSHRRNPSDVEKAHPLTAGQIRKHHSTFLRKVAEQNRSRYSYRFGKRPPGIVAGHKACMKQEVRVPPYMGWRWNIATLGIGKHRPGWRPGAVRKPILMLMQHFLKCFPMDIVPVSTKTECPVHGTGRATTADGSQGHQKPTLQVIKKHGEYCITMNPLRDSEALQTASEPQLPCKPITFKLSKDPRLTKLYKLRHALKQKSLTLCGCKQLEKCNHRTEREKKLLGDEIRLAAKELGLSADTTVADLPSESESEVDFDFTPPAAIIRVDVTKPDVVLTGTQYSQGDYEITEPREVPRETKTKVRSTPASCLPKPIAGADHPGGSKTIAGTKINKPAKAAEGSSKTGIGPGKPTKAGEASRKPATQSGADPKANTPNRKSVLFTGTAQKFLFRFDPLPSGGPTADYAILLGERGSLHRRRHGHGTGAVAVGEGTSGSPDQGTADGKRSGDRHSTKVDVQQRWPLASRVPLRRSFLSKNPKIPSPPRCLCQPVALCYPADCFCSFCLP